MGGEGPNQQEPRSLGEGVLVRQAFVTHAAQGFSPSGEGAEGNIPVAEAFPLDELTFDGVLILHHCWEQRGPSAESRPPVLSTGFSDFLQNDFCLQGWG